MAKNQRDNSSNRHTVGQPTAVGVDSGQLLIIDPSYLGEAFYAELLDHRLSDGTYDLSYLTPGSVIGPLAVVVSTGGDGLFPVEVVSDSDGPCSVTVTVADRPTKTDSVAVILMNATEGEGWEIPSTSVTGAIIEALRCERGPFTLGEITSVVEQVRTATDAIFDGVEQSDHIGIVSVHNPAHDELMTATNRWAEVYTLAAAHLVETFGVAS